MPTDRTPEEVAWKLMMDLDASLYYGGSHAPDVKIIAEALREAEARGAEAWEASAIDNGRLAVRLKRERDEAIARAEIAEAEVGSLKARILDLRLCSRHARADVERLRDALGDVARKLNSRRHPAQGPDPLARDIDAALKAAQETNNEGETK